MYFEDETRYEYSPELPNERLFNFGWLRKDRPFRRAKPSTKVLEVLRTGALNPVNVFRGMHGCDFCNGKLIEVRDRGKMVPIGFGEVWIPGAAGKIFVAPTLVYHYVVAHDYCPPSDVVEAIERLPSDPQSWDTADGYYRQLVSKLDNELVLELIQVDSEGRTTDARLEVYEDPHLAVFGHMPDDEFVLLERLRVSSAEVSFAVSELPLLCSELERYGSGVFPAEAAVLIQAILEFVRDSYAKGLAIKAEPVF